MSVLDRAIIKAFERRSHSATAEKQPGVKAPATAVTAPAQSSAVTPPLRESASSPVQTEASEHGDKFEPAAYKTEPWNSKSYRNPPPVSETPSHLHVPDRVTTAEPVSSQIHQISSAAILDVVQPAVVQPVVVPPAAEQAQVVEPVVEPVVETVPSEPTSQTWQWPDICEQLDQFTGEGFHQLASHLQFAAEQGHKVLAFVSSQRSAGRTSVLLTLTRILALEGKANVLLIDADHRHPAIATLTGLQPVAGFEDVLQGTSRVGQATIPMSPGRVSVLPLLEPMADGTWRDVATTFRVLVHQARRDYDMILMDAGVFGAETKLSECWLRGIADAVVTVSRQLTVQSAEHVVLDWKQIGVESLGVIETFA